MSLRIPPSTLDDRLPLYDVLWKSGGCSLGCDSLATANDMAHRISQISSDDILAYLDILPPCRLAEVQSDESQMSALSSVE